jgi:hypothetical protein
MRQIKNENCEICSFISLYILHVNIMHYNIFNIEINVLINKIQIYE